MAGKAPSRQKKDKAHNAKPYDRPRQGIFSRVASTVKGLFFSASNWGTNVEESNEEPTPSTSSFGNTLNRGEEHTENVDGLPSTSRGLSLLSSQDRPPCPSGLTLSESALEHLRMESQPNFNSRVDNTVTSHMFSNRDDHSDNSDGSASTSGCSSLVSSQDKPPRSSGLKLSESALEQLRMELKPNFSSRMDNSATSRMFSNPHGDFSRNISLWSNGTQSSLANKRPSPAQSCRPSFSVATFAAASKQLPLNRSLASPFYDGNTTYGGASAYRRKGLSNSIPYQINRSNRETIRNQVKVRESQSSNELECMSSAAKRILNTLERMSTPISDAKKIPNSQLPVDIPSLPSQSLKSYLSISRRSPAPSLRGPPIVNLNAVSKLPILKNHNSRLSKKSVIAMPLTEQPIQRIPEECLASPVATPETSKSGGGKMKSKLREPQHATSRRLAEESKEQLENEYELPNISLPITTLPVFSKEPIKSISPEKKLSGKRKTDEPKSDQPVFTFSSPIEHSPLKTTVPTMRENNDQTESNFESPNISLAIATLTRINRDFIQAITPEKKLSGKRKAEESKSDQPVFTFSNPIEHSLPLKTMVPTTRENNAVSQDTEFVFTSPMAVNSKPEFSEKSVAHEPEMILTKSSDNEPEFIAKRRALSEPESPLRINSIKAPEIISQGSVNDLLKKMQDESELKTKKIENEPSQGFGDKFKPKPGTWTCDACLITNSTNHSRCQACETLKPSANLQDIITIVEPEKPETTSSFTDSTKGFGDMFKPKSGTWTCDTCMITNQATDVKCMACETPKPGASNQGASVEPKQLPMTKPLDSTESNSTIDMKVGNEGNGFPTFNFGASPAVSSSADTTSSAPAPVLELAVSQPPAVSGFVFGATPQKTETKAPATSQFSANTGGSTLSLGGNDAKSIPPINFGTSPAVSSTADSTSTPALFKFGVSQPQATGGFIFGATSQMTDTKAPSTPQFSTGTGDNTLKIGGNDAKSFPPINFGTSPAVSSNSTTSTSTASPAMFKFSMSQPPQSGRFVFGAAPQKPESKPISTPQFSAGTGGSTLTLGGNENSKGFPSITFGTSPAVSSGADTTTTAPQAVFKFGASQPPAPSGFVFGAPPQKTEAKSSATPQFSAGTGGFTLKMGGNDGKGFPSMNFVSPAVSSSAGITPSAPQPVFKFGGSQPQSTGGFVFGATPQKTETKTPSTPQFSAGAAAPMKTSGFTGFMPAATSAPNFSFDTPAMSTTPTVSAFSSPAIPSFSFGAKTDQPALAATPTAPIFGGVPASQPLFGLTPTPTFGAATALTFGAPQPPKPEAMSSGFNFSASIPAASTPFRFGSDPAEKKPAITPQASGFNFMPPQVDASSSFTPNFNVSAPSFDFGASAATDRPFQFAANTNESGSAAVQHLQRKIKRGVRRAPQRKD